MPGLHYKDGRDKNGNLIAADGELIKTNDDLKQVKLPLKNITEPIIVYLPGRGEKDSNPTALSKSINFVKGFTSDFPERPEVYIWSHDDKYDDPCFKGAKGYLASLFHIAAVNYIPHYSSSPARELAKGLIMPLVTDENGKPLSYTEAQKNLRNLTVVSYCLGSTTAKEMRSASLEMMEEAGFVPAHARRIYRDLVDDCFANLTSHGKDDQTTVDLVHSDDKMIIAKNAVLKPLSSIKKVAKNLAQTLTGDPTSLIASSSERLTIEEKSKSCVVVSSACRENPYISALRIFGIKRTSDGVKLRGWNPNDLSHDPKGYTKKGLQKDLFKVVLFNSAAKPRTRRFEAMELLKWPDDLPESTPGQRDEYNYRLARGVARGRETAFDRLAKRFLPGNKNKVHLK
jgi:hypothetical protein